jgi:NAD(P)-dependent dehydrogenase (short-subunit alcohol dehydrogenase family)
MKVDLSEQVAVVTGGAAGIGRAIVSTLADNGARVVIVDVDAERARHTATEFSADGRSCVEMVARRCQSRSDGQSIGTGSWPVWPPRHSDQ